MDVFEYGNPNASLILLQMIGDHDIEMIDHEFDLIQKAVSDELCLIACKVDDWNRDLSPWKAPAVFKSESFGENAAKTLSEVLTYIGEKKQPCIIGGYSLAGLFALWAATKTDRFSKVAAASPSVWFPGFTEYIKENNINKIGFSLATLATAPKTFDFPTFFCCWGVAAVAGNVTPKSCVAGILMGTYENQKQ